MNLGRSHPSRHALTRLDVLIVIAVLAIFFMLIEFEPPPSAKRKAQRINCMNNLKEIGLSYRIWGGDNGDQFPLQISATNGGAQELALTGDAAAIFQGMSNELGSPKILICPADLNRFAATDFNPDIKGNISYFVNVEANDRYPQMILSGDDNFAIGGVRVKSGLLEVSAKTPIAWTALRHKFSGNIGVADSSVTMVTSAGLSNLVNQATNRLAIP